MLFNNILDDNVRLPVATVLHQLRPVLQIFLAGVNDVQLVQLTENCAPVYHKNTLILRSFELITIFINMYQNI